MAKFEDLTGQKFGRLTVIKRAENSKCGRTRWLCKCECGNYKDVQSIHLKNKKILSCGCLAIENTIKRNSSHNLSKIRMYKIYHGMKQRCYNSKNPEYHNYGGRGIIICNEWLDKEDGFINFYNWAIQNGYSKDLSIDRIDVNGNYEPSNCRWADEKIQSNNKRCSHYITYKNETHTMKEWCEELNLKYGIVKSRIYRNWTPEEAFETPIGGKING